MTGWHSKGFEQRYNFQQMFNKLSHMPVTVKITVMNTTKSLASQSL